ncbi:serine/threonine-protein kinase [Streptomyces sp. NRRL WC-3742]|uniref:serine/threonine-protein kinase n=1 Tax=Streptomyces sp. NRRL WC-3742 TaxID=1463934 RepID=UPI00068F93BC|nr:serine/threonine-protein kinase [Streptomyces sp. NRRL WC-3742]
MTPLPQYSLGDLVAERFELLERLGAGGTGTVWLARDLVLEREVALKQIRSATDDVHRSTDVRERVLREARALARIDHGKVVAVHEVLDRWPDLWMVMEAVEGRSLHEVLQDGPLSPVRAARIGLDVLGALRAAHAAGVLHRDVKPGNVLIRPDGSAVLTDFGIASFAGSQTLTEPGDIVGSPEYMAPERISGGEVGPASDLWSLGMLLYVCVEGEHPLRHDTVWQTLLAVCEKPVPPPSKAGPLSAVIDALLSRQPDERPSPARLAELLDAAAEGGRWAGPSEANTVVLPLAPARTSPDTLVESPTLVARPVGRPPADSPSSDGAATPRGERRRLLLMLAVLTGTAAVATTAFTLLGSGNRATDPEPSPTAGQKGGWIAQLAEIPNTTDADERDEELAAIQRQVPGATLVDGDAWASLTPGQWIVRAPGGFASGHEAAAFCAEHGTEHCAGRYLSTDEADRDRLCRADASPGSAACRRPDDR